MDPTALEALREAGRVAAAARDLGAKLVVPGARLEDVCRAVEDEIRRRGAAPAFPAQTSRNEVAAHYCPAPGDPTRYEAGDLAKLDIGVHVDGYVVDTALTVDLAGDAESRRMVEAVASALAVAVAVVRPGVEVWQVSAAIESSLRSFGLRPMRNLCGHGVGRWTVHCPPPIPNTTAGATPGRRLDAGAVVAIEPFATDGEGLVLERGPAQVFRVDPDLAQPAAGADPAVVDAVRAFRGLPFARRQLSAFGSADVERTLDALRAAGVLQGYPPLVEARGRPVAQAEHTLYVSEAGVEVLTR